MPFDRSKQALQDILENIQKAQNFIGSASLDEFVDDEKTFYAVIRCLEIISEAARRLDEETRNRAPHLPWRAIMDAGNVYRHAYHDVAEEWVWKTVQDSLPSLKQVVESVLKEKSS